MTLGGTGKIYPGNKLFALSRHEPVGIMFYNAAEFMGVPWETLIKKYRDTPEKEAKATVVEYLSDFIVFISREDICTEEQERQNSLRIVRDNFSMIRDAALDDLRTTVSERRRLSVRDEGNAIRKAASERLSMMKGRGDSPSMAAINPNRIARAHRNEIEENIEQVFGDLNVFRSDRALLHEVFKVAIKSSELSRGNSGIVVAGFGENEMFPTLAEVATDGVIGGLLKYSQLRFYDIGRSGTRSAIVPFAQSEMVQRFMEGIDPELLNYLGFSTEELLFQFGREILVIHGLASDDRLEKLRDVARKQVEDHFEQDVKEFRSRYFVDSIVEAVAHLPKEELAGMAEALVNLTSLKRRVSLDQETVGGPVDIAVISKGDGFVWIKRKHYFDAALNPGYLG